MPHKRINKHLIRSYSLKICKEQYGFTIVEMLIAVALSLMIMSGVYKVFISQNKAYTIQDQVTEMQQNARVAIDMMTREIRMAGYLAEEWISGVDPPTTDVVNDVDDTDPFTQNITPEDIEEMQTSSITFEGDIDYSGATSDRTEMVRYSLSGTTLERERWSWDTVNTKWGDSGGAQPVAENIDSLTLTYYDQTGAETVTKANIRLIKISITARTAREDTGYIGGVNLTGTTEDGTARTRTLTARVRPRNLGL